MITTFLRCQLRYVNCNANTSLDLYQNKNDKEAESLEGLQLYLRNATRVWNVIWKVTFVQKFARDSRDPHLQQSWFFSCLAILGFSIIYKRKPCGECSFIIFCIKYRDHIFYTVRPPFQLRHDKLWERKPSKEKGMNRRLVLTSKAIVNDWRTASCIGKHFLDRRQHNEFFKIELNCW